MVSVRRWHLHYARTTTMLPSRAECPISQAQFSRTTFYPSMGAINAKMDTSEWLLNNSRKCALKTLSNHTDYYKTLSIFRTANTSLKVSKELFVTNVSLNSFHQKIRQIASKIEFSPIVCLLTMQWTNVSLVTMDMLMSWDTAKNRKFNTVRLIRPIWTTRSAPNAKTSSFSKRRDA